LQDCQGALEDLNEVNVLEPNDASILKLQIHVQQNLHEHQGSLEVLDKVDVFARSYSFTLKGQECMCEDYQRTLEEFEDANYLEPNVVITRIKEVIHMVLTWQSRQSLLLVTQKNK
jgi:hypothetical protein